MNSELGPEDLVTPTYPPDCAVLIALPTSYEDFVGDVEAMPKRGHYIWTVVRDYGEIDKGWEKIGKKVATLCLEVANVALEAGAKVYRQAGLSQLKDAARSHRVIVIVGHWRRPEVHSSDFRVGPDIFLDHATSSGGEIAHRIRDARTIDFEERLRHFSNVADQQAELASLLNERILKPIDATPSCGGGDLGEWEVFWSMTEARERLEKEFPGMLEAGNVIEFRDGFHKASVVRDSFPADWCGIVDFAVCHSEYPAACVKDGKDRRRVIFNRREKYPSRYLREITETFLRLPHGWNNYGALRSEVYRAFQRLSDGVTLDV